MKRKDVLIILLLATLSGCSQSNANEKEDSHSSNDLIDNAISTNYSETNNESAPISDNQSCETGLLVTHFESPNRIPKNTDININVFCGHAWIGTSFLKDGDTDWKYKLALDYGKTPLSNRVNIEKTYEYVADLPDFNTEKYDAYIPEDAKGGSLEFIFKKSLEIKIDKSVFQITDNEYGVISFEIRICDFQDIDITDEVREDFGCEGNSYYFYNDENDIIFSSDTKFLYE